MKIYVFGNLLVKEDARAVELVPWLQKKFPNIQFKITDPNENFPPNNEENIIILDSVEGLKKPTILRFEDLQSLKKTPDSPHDYDLMFHLQLLRKMKKIKYIKIIGIPVTNSKNIVFKWIKNVIPDLIRNPELNRFPLSRE